MVRALYPVIIAFLLPGVALHLVGGNADEPYCHDGTVIAYGGNALLGQWNNVFSSTGLAPGRVAK